MAQWKESIMPKGNTVAPGRCRSDTEQGDIPDVVADLLRRWGEPDHRGRERWLVGVKGPVLRHVVENLKRLQETNDLEQQEEIQEHVKAIKYILDSDRPPLNGAGDAKIGSRPL